MEIAGPVLNFGLMVMHDLWFILPPDSTEPVWFFFLPFINPEPLFYVDLRVMQVPFISRQSTFFNSTFIWECYAVSKL